MEKKLSNKKLINRAVKERNVVLQAINNLNPNSKESFIERANKAPLSLQRSWIRACKNLVKLQYQA